MSVTFVDMFAGAGLFSAGLMKAGLQPVLAVELDSNAVCSYQQNVAACVLRGSILEIDSVPKADVLVAGPPCQGFSTLGRQDPRDARNQLSLQVPIWAKRTRARVVVIENVPPFLRSPHWKRVCKALIELGFQVGTWELDAADFGVPQLRRRAFTVASKVGMIDAPAFCSRRRTAGQVIDRPIAQGDPMHRWPIPQGIAAERIALIPPGGDKRDISKLAPQSLSDHRFRQPQAPSHSCSRLRLGVNQGDPSGWSNG
jgi:DNA (cytosine-5)-methyltransferase 1